MQAVGRMWKELGEEGRQSSETALTFLGSCSSLSWAQLSGLGLHILNLGLGSTGMELQCVSKPSWGFSWALAPLGLHLGQFDSPEMGRCVLGWAPLPDLSSP